MTLPGWDHVPNMSELEKRCASLWFKLKPESVTGPVSGLLIGECPGANTSPKLPMFPWPASSSGGRLLKMSNVPVNEYLGRLERRNLIHTHHPVWPVHDARRIAREIVQEIAGRGLRVVLLGKKVGEAFGAPQFWAMAQLGDTHFTCIPHPSGLSRVYNDKNNRVMAGLAIQWATNKVP